MSELTKLIDAVMAAKSEADLFFEKGNNSAGTRARVKLQEVKALAQAVRNEIQEKKNQK